MLDERTIYNYVDAGLLSVGNIDLPRNRLFSFLYGETILPNLGIQDIPANDINLTPRLLKK